MEKAREPLFTTKLTEEQPGLGFTIMEIFADEVEVISELNVGTTVICTKARNMSEDLFYNNVNYVIKLVKRLNYHFCDQEDLIQAGLMGLYEATKHYDTNKKVLFTTYATYYIVGAIKKEMRNCRLIKFSKEMYRLFRKLKRLTQISHWKL